MKKSILVPLIATVALATVFIVSQLGPVLNKSGIELTNIQHFN